MNPQGSVSGETPTHKSSGDTRGYQPSRIEEFRVSVSGERPRHKSPSDSYSYQPRRTAQLILIITKFTQLMQENPYETQRASYIKVSVSHGFICRCYID